MKSKIPAGVAAVIVIAAIAVLGAFMFKLTAVEKKPPVDPSRMPGPPPMKANAEEMMKANSEAAGDQSQAGPGESKETKASGARREGEGDNGANTAPDGSGEQVETDEDQHEEVSPAPPQPD